MTKIDLMNKPTAFLMTIGILLVVSLGCLGPSASDSQCEATVSAGGKTYSGKAKNEDQAGRNACNKYCLATDDKAKGMVEIWLASDKAKAFEKRMKRKPTPEDAVIEDKTILDYVTKDCSVKCKDEANNGNHTLKTECKQ